MSEVFEVLSDREHTLKKAHIMVGSLAEEDYSTYISGKYTTLKVVPALLVIVREIIDNAIDEFARSGMKAATKIKITMDAMSLTVEDNGRGIPIERYVNEENKIDEWRPVLCWTQLRAGTSFTNHTIGPSSNGVGSSVANILSLVFKGETWDGEQYCCVTCSENMGNKAVRIEKKKHATGTKVYIEPDFERFGVVGFTPDHINAAKERIIALSSVYPEITFTFNGEKIRTKKAKEYLEVYEKPYVLYDTDNYFFAVMPTELDEYYQQSYIDGLYVRSGGTHEAYISRELSYVLRDLIKKKHKIDMSPAEIKRGLFLCFNARFFPSLKFDSQTKERLTNSEAEVKSYLGDINFEKLAKEILNTPEIIEPIIEAKLAKQIAAEKRAITLEQKKMTKKYVEKHIPAKSKKIENTVLLLTEGDCLEEHTKVKSLNEYGLVIDKEIRDITVGDIVFTHNHKLRSVLNVTKKIKSGVRIKVCGCEEIIASKEHKFYVYDIKDNEFKFLPVYEIDKTIHKFVKSHYFDISDGFIQLTSIEPSNNEKYDYLFGFSDIDYSIQTSKSHTFVRFNSDKFLIEKVRAEDILVGDYLCLVKFS